jgi:hypothetical protein
VPLYCLLSRQVKKCLSIKGAEDAINKPHAFEVSTTDCSMFFIADSDKVGVVRQAGVFAGRMLDRVYQKHIEHFLDTKESLCYKSLCVI